jgi:hypothetical protein
MGNPKPPRRRFMNDRFSLEDHEEQGVKTEQLVSSGNSEEVLRSFWKSEDGNDGKSSGPSKYSRILSCLFVRGPEESISLKTTKAERN